jgi:sulfate/thiosulfate transport system substrate-binding protein
MVVSGKILGRWLRTAILIVLLGALFLYGLWPWLPFRGWATRPKIIVFYGASMMERVMKQEIFPTFQRLWLKETGERVEIISSFSGSGTITNQILMGVPAELALFSLELDAHRLSDTHLIPNQSWQRLPWKGVLNQTPIVLLVRPGNPLGIHDFTDLVRPGVKIIHPDPLTSGGSNWAIVAEYASALNHDSGLPQAAYDQLLGIWRNVVARASSARAARTMFENGFGDVLITYEQDVLYDRALGVLKGEIVYPQSSILCEHILVVIDKNIPPAERGLVDMFTTFLWSEQAQRIFVKYGFRSNDVCLNEERSDWGNVSELIRIEDFGGWKKAKLDIIERIWKGQVLNAIPR